MVTGVSRPAVPSPTIVAIATVSNKPPELTSRLEIPMPTDNAVFIPLVSVHEQQQDAGVEEKDAVHNAEGEARLQHRTSLIDIDREGGVGGLPEVSKGAQANVQRAGGEIGATGIGNIAKLDHTRDESADEAHVDERNEVGGFASRSVAEQSRYTPGRRQNGCYEEHEDVVGRY